MSKIRIFGLGGLNESGKNTYVVEIDNKIFVLDCGLKYATDNEYGIDYILPDYSYLKQNKDKIVGVFLNHLHHPYSLSVHELKIHLQFYLYFV
ncbi:MAG: ribonuclease J, partial [Bacilli bacterium]|nr:ribonuclease J [Bacilli bacterium]